MSRKVVNWARFCGTLALLLSIAFAALSGPNQVSAQTDSGSDSGADSGVSGDSYTSPDFGYSFEWDRSWDVTDEAIKDGYNMLQLDDGASFIYFEGYSPALAVDECLQTYGIDYLTGQDGISDVESTEPNETDGVLSTELTFVVTFTDDTTGDERSADFSGFISCQEINDGDANLVISQFGRTDAWTDEDAARQDILDTLTLQGETPTATATEEVTPDETSAPGETPGAVMTEPEGDGELPANSDDLLALFQSSINDINDFWTREYPLISGGQEYTPPAAFVPWNGSLDTPCGNANSFDEATGEGDGPFYCPVDKTIYLDMGFANFQFDQVGQVPFLIPVVLAHETGHHVQDLLGMQVCEQTPCLDPNQLTSQEIEYMADCYAGSWSRDAELRGRLGERDIDANIVQYAVILGGGQEGADPGGHGRGAERVWWFLNGYLEGSAKCFETSAVTKNWAQTGPPNAQTDVTPIATEEPTEEATSESTEEATQEPSGDVAQMGDTVNTDEGVLIAQQTGTETEIERRKADGQFVIVYLEVDRPEGGNAPFNYDGWTLIDADGNSYDLDERTTDILLSSAYENGMDEELEAGMGYNIAMVFDVPADASGLMLVNENLGVQIALDI